MTTMDKALQDAIEKHVKEQDDYLRGLTAAFVVEMGRPTHESTEETPEAYTYRFKQQIRVRLRKLEEAKAEEREACAKVAESYEPHCESCPRGVAAGIRARGGT